MYNEHDINQLIEFVSRYNGVADKAIISQKVQLAFSLVKDRSVFYNDSFAIRFCMSKKRAFSNTVLALSVLQKYDKKPFIVCLITPETNYLMLANSSFLKKISHSSQELSVNNIKGSFNGSDIERVFNGCSNEPNNFEFLFSSHENYTFEENLSRLVEQTNNIVPTGEKFIPTIQQEKCIYQSITRAKEFIKSDEYSLLNEDLHERVNSVANEIAIAAFIENVNIRGRIIEYLITATDELHKDLIYALKTKTKLPQIFTADKLGDYERVFKDYFTETDIKTKVLFLSSQPKGYNIDKLLSFLSEEKSVYLIYVVAIDSDKSISTQLCSMFNTQLLRGTRTLFQWAGRNSRGVTQYDGKALEQIVSNFDPTIDDIEANKFINRCING